ncbi:MAG: lipase family protein [Phycisphaerales bacterium]|nr:lipase family protein [Phycisphaerales bacterium]
MRDSHRRIAFPLSIVLLIVLLICCTQESLGQKPKMETTVDHESLIDQLVESYEPCAGSPFPAVCRCALEFPPVSFDTRVAFDLESVDGSEYSQSSGWTLMNLVRGIVVAARPIDDSGVKLYVNPPATPDAFERLQGVISRNPSFKGMSLVKVIMLPRHVGGSPDRLFGAIWWIAEEKRMVVIFRGTQTPFEWYLDQQAGTHRRISNSFDVADGFGAAYQFCQTAVLGSIESHEPDEVVVGGHSLGGAVAGIAAFDLHQRSLKSGRPYKVRAMTFGQPRTFAPDDADLVNKAVESGDLDLWRIVNLPDPVPPSPPAAVTSSGTKYKHTSRMVLYDEDVSALPGKDSAWNHHYYYDGYFDVDAKGVVCTP